MWVTGTTDYVTSVCQQLLIDEDVPAFLDTLQSLFAAQ